MRDRYALVSPLVVVGSALLSSASFLLNNGRTEWYLLKPLYRVFGEVALSATGFIVTGVILYVILWVYISVSLYVILRIFRNKVSIQMMFQTVSAGFILPHAFIFPCGLFSNYYIHLAGIALFGIIIPFSVTPYAMRRATEADFYRRSLSLFISLFGLLVFWTSFFEPLGLI